MTKKKSASRRRAAVVRDAHISIKVPAEVRDRWAASAVAEHRTLTAVIEIAVERYIGATGREVAP